MKKTAKLLIGTLLAVTALLSIQSCGKGLAGMYLYQIGLGGIAYQGEEGEIAYLMLYNELDELFSDRTWNKKENQDALLQKLTSIFNRYDHGLLQGSIILSQSDDGGNVYTPVHTWTLYFGDKPIS
ncbi:MAG: hypothetical protein IJS02_02455 [Bacteroidales bacterium]|nr:hypothetical protein [Bacteroidales bacterium]